MAYTQYTVFFYYYFDYFLRVNVCWSWVCLMVFRETRERAGDEKMIPPRERCRTCKGLHRGINLLASVPLAAPEKPFLWHQRRRLYAHSRRIIPPPSKIIFCVPCAIKIGESNKLGRQGIRFIVSLAAISELFVRSNEEWAPSTWSKNHKTQFTMANAKKRRKRWK